MKEAISRDVHLRTLESWFTNLEQRPLNIVANSYQRRTNDLLTRSSKTRELKQLRRRRRQLQETIDLMIKTTALHVHHAF